MVLGWEREKGCCETARVGVGPLHHDNRATQGRGRERKTLVGKEQLLTASAEKKG